ncbi:hypothetical protein ACEQ103284_11180 [Actinobacillus equuli subsp. equuli]
MLFSLLPIISVDLYPPAAAIPVDNVASAELSERFILLE